MINRGDDVRYVDTSGITDMSELFEGNSTFNQDISGWDVSNVTEMYGMFMEADAFDQDISGWDISGVTNMNMMFCCAKSMSHDLSHWNTSKSVMTESMFDGAYNYIYVSEWIQKFDHSMNELEEAFGTDVSDLLGNVSIDQMNSTLKAYYDNVKT